MPPLRQLLTFVAAFEILTGLALILAPVATTVFILGAELDVVGVMLGRVCGGGTGGPWYCMLGREDRLGECSSVWYAQGHYFL